MIEGYCRRALRARPTSVQKAGNIFFVSLEDGRAAAIKIHRSLPLAHLSAAYALQEKLRAAGFPCAALISPPTQEGDAIVVAHEHFAPGVSASADNARTAKALARGLADLTSGLAGATVCGLRKLTPEPGQSRVPTSLHDIMGRACATIAAAEIDCISHADWRARNIRFRKSGTRISAAYDFDSLANCSEAAVVGSTSVLFHGAHGHLTVNPDPATAASFVRMYEQSRGRSLDGTVVRAGMLYALCRCAADIASAEQIALRFSRIIMPQRR